MGLIEADRRRSPFVQILDLIPSLITQAFLTRRPIMNVENTHHGKILTHGRGIGGISSSEIERRAEEIALIEGKVGGASQETLRLAKDELSGAGLQGVSEDDETSTISINRDPGDPVSVHGRQIPMLSDDDEQETVERLAIEGVEEAQHEQMLADRLRNRGYSS